MEKILLIGHPCDNQWTVRGQSVDSQWTVFKILLIGHPMDIQRTVRGQSVDSQWIVNGKSMESQRICVQSEDMWTASGQSVDTICLITNKNTVVLPRGV